MGHFHKECGGKTRYKDFEKGEDVVSTVSIPRETKDIEDVDEESSKAQVIAPPNDMNSILRKLSLVSPSLCMSLNDFEKTKLKNWDLNSLRGLFSSQLYTRIPNVLNLESRAT